MHLRKGAFELRDCVREQIVRLEGAEAELSQSLGCRTNAGLQAGRSLTNQSEWESVSAPICEPRLEPRQTSASPTSRSSRFWFNTPQNPQTPILASNTSPIQPLSPTSYDESAASQYPSKPSYLEANADDPHPTLNTRHATASIHLSTMSESLTTKQVAEHASVDNGLYIIIDGGVYKMDTFVDEHPGGAKILKRVGGKDASKQFWKVR